MTTPLRVGVWGVGLMGERHARVLSTLPDARLVAVYDANADRAQAVATRYGTQVASSPEALLAEVDAISIATPTPLHFAHVEQSLSLGKHVLVEKAITEQVDQAEVLTALARRTGKLLMVGHIERYNPVFTELKRLIHDGQQRPFAIVFRRLSSFSTSSQAVDVVLDLMIHDIDLMLDLVRGQTVSHHDGLGRVVRTRDIDHSVAHVSFHGGPVVTLTASRVTEHKVRSIEVTTPSAFIVADLLRKEIQSYRNAVSSYQAADGGVSYQQHTQVDQIQIPTIEPLLLELQDFVRAARTGQPPLVSAEDATEALRLTQALRLQMLSGLAYPCSVS